MKISEVEKFNMLQDLRIIADELTKPSMNYGSKWIVEKATRIYNFIDSIPVTNISDEEMAAHHNFAQAHQEAEDYSWMGEQDEHNYEQQ